MPGRGRAQGQRLADPVRRRRLGHVRVRQHPRVGHRRPGRRPGHVRRPGQRERHLLGPVGVTASGQRAGRRPRRRSSPPASSPSPASGRRPLRQGLVDRRPRARTRSGSSPARATPCGCRTRRRSCTAAPRGGRRRDERAGGRVEPRAGAGALNSPGAPAGLCAAHDGDCPLPLPGAWPAACFRTASARLAPGASGPPRSPSAAPAHAGGGVPRSVTQSASRIDPRPHRRRRRQVQVLPARPGRPGQRHRQRQHARPGGHLPRRAASRRDSHDRRTSRDSHDTRMPAPSRPKETGIAEGKLKKTQGKPGGKLPKA